MNATERLFDPTFNGVTNGVALIAREANEGGYSKVRVQPFTNGMLSIVNMEAKPNGRLSISSVHLSPAAARHLADVLNRAADEAERKGWNNQNQEESA